MYRRQGPGVSLVRSGWGHRNNHAAEDQWMGLQRIGWARLGRKNEEAAGEGERGERRCCGRVGCYYQAGECCDDDGDGDLDWSGRCDGEGSDFEYV